ncbi:MAG: adenosylcobinamide-GDP ribazoletransferase [Spirochaetes bacterium]|nr:adenosylcobinamide-GDP ribazoletransferase [Spirochaetota bacterium]
MHLQFLTRIPVPIRLEYDDRAFAAGSAFAPIIGLLIGMISVGAYLLFGLLDNTSVAVIAAMIAEIGVTGGLHLDGLADTFDGFFSYRERERVLSIMKDSRLGTSGAIALFLTLLVKYLLLFSLPDAYLARCIVVMPVLSRMTIAWSAGLSPYARENDTGPAAGLVRHTGAVEIVLATIAACVASVLFLRLALIPLVMIIIAFALAANLYAKFRIGGITGDVIGAVIELSEVVFLLSVLVLDKLFSWQHLVFL